MKLTAFQVKNYRSINDSGRIELDDCVALVGRNESGKTNLLLALASLNPPTREIEALSFVKDFPRDRPKTDFSEDLDVVETWWSLTSAEQSKLTSIFPRAEGVCNVTVGRRYKAGPRWVGLADLKALSVDESRLKAALDKAKRSINGALAKCDDDTAKAAILESLDEVFESQSPSRPLKPWAEALAASLSTLRAVLKKHGIAVPDNAATQLAAAESITAAVVNDDELYAKARNWISQQMPIFVYIAEKRGQPMNLRKRLNSS